MKLPNFLFKRVKEHKTSLGNNEAFPPEEDYPFDYKILKDRYNDVVENIKAYGDIESLDENYLISLLNNLITQCKEKEKPLKEQLEKLCKKIVSETFRIPNETITLNITLTDKLEPTQKYQLTPQTSSERSFDFDDLEDFHNAEKSILKRRLINSLIQGASYEYMTKCVMHLDEITTLLSNLKPIYERIIAINDFLLFSKEESITDEKIHQGAIVEVMLGRGGDKTEINVQGLIFPFLLNETFRGMFELFASHGLPKDLDKANYILTHSEFLLAEPWDLRFGVNLWKIVSDNVYGYESMPYFFMTLCEMPIEEFNANMKEVFAKTKRGKQFIIDLNEFALKESEYEFDIEPLIIQDETDDLITDAYISSDGLDSYYLSDENTKTNSILGESNTFETWFGNSVLVDSEGEPIKMYHGTKNKFDEFSKDFIGSTGSYEGYGFNFTPFEGRAANYNNENVIEAYLRAENPMTSKSYKITPSKLAKIIAELDKGKPYTDTIVAAYEPSRYNEKWDAMYYRRALPVAAKMIYQYNKENDYGDAGLYAEICVNGNADKYQVIDLFERLGYDSVIFYDNDDRINTVIVFEPNQIKLVSNKTFNNDSNLMSENKTNNKKKIYINESHLSLLTESQESKSEHQAVRLVMNRFGYSKERAYEFVHKKVRQDIDALKDKELGKFILGVTRMCCDGELNDARAINDINATLILLKAHLNEYDRNLNGLSAQELISRFAQIRQDNLDAEKSEIDQMTFGESNYKIVPINSFEEAEQYNKYCYQYDQWCLTHMEEMYDSYTCNGINQIYFCLRNGFENVKPIVGEGCPLDDYGLSMISVIVNENGELAYCTTRWNHSNGGNDSVMNAKEISQVIGMNFFNVFNPNNVWRDLVNDAMSRLNAGESIYEVFDDNSDFCEGLIVVGLNNKYNFINANGELLSPNQWFDDCFDFNNGFAKVKSNNKYNFINHNGELLSPNKWFDGCDDYFYNGFAIVELDSKYNFINTKGKLLFPNQWFDSYYDCYNGFTIVELDGKYNFVNVNGKLVSPNKWFDGCDNFYNDFGIVRLNGEQYYINTEGQIIGEVNENTNNKSYFSLLREGLYDNFDVRDADKICYNYYEEDFGDDEEPDIQNLYNIQVWDMFSNLIYENDDLNTDELEELLGVDIASKIYNNEGVSNNDEYYPYCLRDFNSHIFGDPNETARFIFRDKLTDYFPNLHGFILKDGMCIDLTNHNGNYDHSLVSSSVPQLDDKLDFVAIGNIRCSINSFDLIQPPTKQQKYTLRKLIANSHNLIVDIYSEDTKYVLTSAEYRGNPNPSYVLGEIDRFFNEGINLQGGYSSEYYDDFYMYESIEYLTESELDDMKPQEEQEINYEDLILSCSEGDIDFREEPYNLFTVSGGKQRGMWTLHVIINGVEIPTEFIFLRAEEYPKLQSYQLHMEIAKNLRQKGVGFKLYQAFIRIFGTTCDLFINNSSTFYKDNNASIDSDVAVDKLWDKLIKLPNVKVSYIVNKLKQKVGVKVTLKQ